MLLAQSHANLAQWDECVDAARNGLRRGGLNRTDQTNLILGNCLAQRKEYPEARTAFLAAARDQRSRGAANSWIEYVDSEEERERTNREALEALRRN